MTSVVALSNAIVSSGSELRIAVVSDLHAYDKSQGVKDGDAPSFLEIGANENDATIHPIAGLRDLIQRDSIRADLLLCPGDLGDKSHPASVQYAWRKVHEIGNAICAKALIATAGNHDVDSRHVYNDYDARGLLQSLVPGSPASDEALADRYWSRHFAVRSWSDLRLVTLNSSAYHGTGSSTNNAFAGEYTHGRLAKSTLDGLLQALSLETPSRLNILLCHHHPQPVEEYGLGDKDIMTGGAELLRCLGTGQYGEWFIVHGHTHFPKLSYATGTNTAPIVMASGSLCATLQKEIQGKARNQFYVLSFPLDKFAEFGLVGRFQAWDWNFGIGWQPAQSGSGLPHEGGFGMRAKPGPLAQQVIQDCNLRWQTQWQELLIRLPQLAYFLPGDLELVLQKVQDQGTLRVAYDADGNVLQIDRVP